MNWILNFFHTSIGKKQLMALTGLGLAGFLVTHLSGNLLIFIGEEAFNGYAEFLAAQAWLPLARIGLIACLALHLYLALNLTFQNQEARKTDYYFKDPSDASLGARSMLLTGVLILVYVVIHLMNFTFDDYSSQGLYALVVTKLSSPVYGLLYILAMGILALHLAHAIQSTFQSFGINHRAHSLQLKKLLIGFAVALCLGFASIPIFLMITKGAV